MLANIWRWIRCQHRAVAGPVAPSPEITAAADMLRTEILNRTTMAEQLREEAAAALRSLRERDAEEERQHPRRRYG